MAALSPARVAQRVSMGRWLLRLTVRIVAIVRLTRAIFVLDFVFNSYHCLRLKVKICQFLRLPYKFFGRFTVIG